MPLEAKPLFRPDVLRTHLGAFAMPERVEATAPKLTHWAELLSTRRAPPNPKSKIENPKSRGLLDRPFAGRRMSAVDQAYRYAINLPCDWIVVTSVRETRLSDGRQAVPATQSKAPTSTPLSAQLGVIGEDTAEGRRIRKICTA